MTAFLAIVKLTCRSAVRSHVFQILLGVLLFTVIALPLTVVGDGTAHSQIQVSLQYCLGAVSFLLSISTIWLGCFVMGTDIESYQIHLLITKPVSRVKLWLGKCTGIIVIHTVLLLIAATLIYVIILLQFHDPAFITYLKLPLLIFSIAALVISVLVWVFNFLWKWNAGFRISAIILTISLCFYCLHLLVPKEVNKQSFSSEEKQRIRNEVLVGRRVFMPTLPDTRKIIEQVYQARLKEVQSQKKDISEDDKRNLLLEISKQVTASLGEVQPGQPHLWVYEGLNKEEKNPMYLRYRTYVGKVSSKEQRETMGIWAARIEVPAAMVQKDQKPGNADPKNTTTIFTPRTDYPEKIMCGIFNEIVMSNQIIDDKGTAMVAFANYDPQGKILFFQLADGPKLLVKVSGFWGNYARGILMIFAKIVFLAGLSCAIGGIISIPVAIFTIISYLLFGAFSSYLIGIDTKMAAMGGPSSGSAYDIIGNFMSRALMLFIIPMQKFEISYLLAGGELIEFSYIAKVLFFYVFLKSIFILALGIWIYRRREMGLVIRK